MQVVLTCAHVASLILAQPWSDYVMCVRGSLFQQWERCVMFWNVLFWNLILSTFSLCVFFWYGISQIILWFVIFSAVLFWRAGLLSCCGLRCCCDALISCCVRVPFERGHGTPRVRQLANKMPALLVFRQTMQVSILDHYKTSLT